MKLLKRLLLAILITILALIVEQKIMPEWQNSVQAASIKISSKKKTMYKGYTYTLKVTGTKKKVTWTSSNKSKATVNSKGKVYAKKNGKVTITAKVGNKKYTCKVTVKNKPYKLVQFNTTFYDLKDVAKEYRYVEKVKNYKDFIFDLDGDGKKDKITLKNLGKNEYNYNIYELRYKGKAFLKEDEFIEAVYVADLNKNDKTLELIVKRFGGGDSVDYYIYSKIGNNIKLISNKIGAFYGNDYELKIDQKGKIVINELDLQYISPKVFSVYYQFNNNKVKEKKLDAKKIKNIKFSTKGNTLFTSNMGNLDKYFKYIQNFDNDKAYKKAEIIEGKFKSFSILKLNHNGEVRVKLKNGTKGYIFGLAGHIAG